MAATGVMAYRRFSLQLADDYASVFSRLADAAYGGNMSRALRGLLDEHAGKILAREQERLEQATAVEPVVTWAKPKLSRELATYVAGMIRAGVLEADAFKLAGATPRQWSRWTLQGRRDREEGKQSVAADLVHAIERAQAELKAQRVKRIEASPEWRAQLALLARQFPDEYGERKRVDSNVQHNVRPMVDYSLLTLDEARTLVRLLRKAQPNQAELGAGMRAAAELVPVDVLTVVDGDAERLELEAPKVEAPAIGHAAVEAPGVEAPAVGEKPQT